MRRYFLISILIGSIFVLGCGQGEYDSRLQENINNPKRMGNVPPPAENEEEEPATEEESGEWTLEDLEKEDAARAAEQ